MSVDRSAIAMRAWIEGDQFVMQGDLWKGYHSLASFDRWLDFYRRMAERRRGQYAEAYQGSVDALEGIEAEVRMALDAK